MKKAESNVVIIGAGLTGLALAYLLRNEDISVNIIEARDRVGGRIHTKYNDISTSIDLGATWLGEKHKALLSLLKELNIEIFQQVLGETAVYEPMSINPPQIVKLPPNNDPSYRIQGGTSRIIRKLVHEVDSDRIYLNQKVISIEQKERMSILSSNYEFTADVVISTLPPYLFDASISTIPALPESISEICQATHTWMGESIKVGLTYAKPFWREENLSGTIFSNVGPIPEMYDHSNYQDNKFALKGFFNGSYHSITEEERKQMVLNQLEKYYGPIVNDYLTYEETVWSKEMYTYVPYDSYVLPHQNNGHEIYRKRFLDGRLFIGGTETAAEHPGYMNGAVDSAIYLSKEVKQFFKL